MKPTILITGASGFVGRKLVSKLRDRNINVKLVARDNKIYNDCILTDNLFLETDEKLVEMCQGIDIVIHLAWYVETGKYIDSLKNIECLEGTIRLANACVKAKVKKFIGIGTCFEYDLSSGYVSTESPILPQSLYAACKASAFFITKELFKLNNIKFLWCRLFYLYGDGEDSSRLVPFIKDCMQSRQTANLTDGSQIRDYMDIESAANEIANEALGEAVGEINICSGIPISIKDFAINIADQYCGRELLNFGGKKSNTFDPPIVVGIKKIGRINE